MPCTPACCTSFRCSIPRSWNCLRRRSQLQRSCRCRIHCSSTGPPPHDWVWGWVQGSPRGGAGGAFGTVLPMSPIRMLENVAWWPSPLSLVVLSHGLALISLPQLFVPSNQLVSVCEPCNGYVSCAHQAENRYHPPTRLPAVRCPPAPKGSRRIAKELPRRYPKVPVGTYEGTFVPSVVFRAAARPGRQQAISLTESESHCATYLPLEGTGTFGRRYHIY